MCRKREEAYDIREYFEFRDIFPDEAGQAARIEEICFPPNEACSEKMMRERIAKAPELFLVAVNRESGKIAGFLNGLSTEESKFRDEFFVDAELYDPAGRNVMLLGLDVLPEYRGRGLAREIMSRYLRRERERGRREVFLTCLESKVEMYKRMGFQDHGMAESAWGGEQWHEMSCVLNPGRVYPNYHGEGIPQLAREYYLSQETVKKYGTYTIAREYDDRGKIDEWMQRFLRNDGHNLELADGLLLQERRYIGIRRIPLSLLVEIKSGAPEYLHDQDSIDYFFQVVDQMKQDYENWDTPPLIVEYGEKGFHVNDGRHRLEMYRQMGITHAPAALWTTGEQLESRLIKLLENCQ